MKFRRLGHHPHHRNPARLRAKQARGRQQVQQSHLVRGKFRVQQAGNLVADKRDDVPRVTVCRRREGVQHEEGFGVLDCGQ